MKFRKNAIAVSISREMAVGMGFIEPNREERYERAVLHERWRRESAAREQRYAAGYSALLNTDPITRAVLDLHAPVSYYSRLVCQGCDADGYDTEHPEWPCRTIETLAHAHHLDMTYQGEA
ncbi:MAG: hypothetical protein P1U38_09680 [Aeromicrobium sp.]|uniref:hypothetical protein n=1 Tax=Aeromicrobium sp. TaxID=1871063 RepID=UPI002608D90A|nr:hypothetical protein [Aeromicrobium sp.]MDF1705031.1 hypothetical protein [Aeromicrobium sp.]